MSLLSRFTSDADNGINVVIMGATGGIGYALANSLLSLDNIACLYLISRTPFDQNTLPATIARDKVQVLRLDYEDEASIELAAKQTDVAIDIMIVATGILHDDAGLAPEKSIQQLTTANFTKNLLVNAIGPSLVAKHFLPRMRRNTKAVFAILSARVGSISDNRLGGWYAYRASKAAVNMMIKTLSIELARRHPQHIIVGLHPGTVDTALSKPFQRNVPSQALFDAKYSAHCLLSVINQLSVADSGFCFAWDGQRILE